MPRRDGGPPEGGSRGGLILATTEYSGEESGPPA